MKRERRRTEMDTREKVDVPGQTSPDINAFIIVCGAPRLYALAHAN